jgi:hypothetical protein
MKEAGNFRRRTSISLPDICLSVQQQQIAAQQPASISTSKQAANTTSTPSNFKSSISSTTLAARNNLNRKDISIIFEEKENPNAMASLNRSALVSSSLKPKAAKKKLVECREISIQCNKSDEDMLTSEGVENTPFWKMLAHNRFRALIKARKENEMVKYRDRFPCSSKKC